MHPSLRILGQTPPIFRTKRTGVHPINFEWTFGFNRRIPCLNLTDENRNVILYASSHVTVLYDYKSNSQRLLQGHVSQVVVFTSSRSQLAHAEPFLI